MSGSSPLWLLHSLPVYRHFPGFFSLQPGSDPVGLFGFIFPSSGLQGLRTEKLGDCGRWGKGIGVGDTRVFLCLESGGY